MAIHAENNCILITKAEKTALLGGHFIYNSNWTTIETPHSANIVQTVEKNGVDVSSNPTQWEHNVNIGTNGISLRYNEAVMAQLIADENSNNAALKFYRPPGISGSTTTQGALTMELTNNALNFYGSSTSTADATLASTGLKLSKGGIEAGTKNTTDYIYVYSNDDATNHKLTINSHEASDWRIIAGNKFGVDKAGNLYASNANIAGILTAGANSKIGPWTVTATSIYKGNATYGTSGTGNMYFGDSGLSISNTFKVSNAGVLSATGATINGAITATSGSIGGFHITTTANTGTSANGGHTYTTSLYRPSGDGTTYEYEVGIKGDATENPSSTDTQYGNLAFYVKRINKGANWSTATSMFYVTHGGKLYAQDAEITGKITATSGYIGGTSGWTIASQQLYSGTIGTDNSLHLGTKNLGSSTSIAGRSGSDWRLTVGSGFGVTNTGAVYASSGAIGGSVTIGGTAASTVLTNITNAGKTASNFISGDSTNGIKVSHSSPSSATTNYVQITGSGVKIVGNNANGYSQITSSGLEVFANINSAATSVASFGSTARIGHADQNNIYIDGTSLKLRNGSTVLANFTSTGIDLGTAAHLYSSGYAEFYNGMNVNGTVDVVNSSSDAHLNADIINVYNHFNNIYCGLVNAGTVSANSYKDVTLDYSARTDWNEYTLPVVVATLFSSGTAVNIGNTTVAVHSVEQHTAKCRIFNNRSASISPYIMWMAVNIRNR